MRKIGASEARKTLSRLLDRVVAGGEIAITRHGRAVAWLVPPRSVVDTESAQDAVAAIRAMRKGVKLRGLSLKHLVVEGRR
jgi:prevent-host-death family protein